MEKIVTEAAISNPALALATSTLGAGYLLSQVDNMGPPIQGLNQLQPVGGGQFIPQGQLIERPNTNLIPQNVINQEPIANNSSARQTSFPTHNSRGQQIPVVKINLFPEEEKKEDLDDNDSLEMPDFEDSDTLLQSVPQISQEPSQQQQISQPPMGGPVPPQFQEFVERNRQRMNDIDQQNQQQIDQIAQIVEPEAEGNRLERARQFARNINQFMQEMGITYNNIISAIDTIRHIYNLWRETNLPEIPNSPPDDIPDQQNDINKFRTDWFQQNGVPPQCKRRVYVDQSGLVRSIVICESNNDQRIYHDK